MDYNTYVFLIQILMIITLLVVAVFLMKLTIAAKYERRIKKYTINNIIDSSTSYFDRANYVYLKIRSSLSKRLKKIKVFDQYSLKYEKYTDKTKIIPEEAMDYISLKIIAGITFLTVVIVSDVLRYKPMTFLQLFTAFLIGFFAPDVFLIAKKKILELTIRNDILKAVIIMNNAFKSGRSTMQAIKIVSEELTGPISNEFKKMYIDLTFGLSLEDVFSRFSKRINIKEVKYITTSLTILNKTGGNIVKVFSSIERSFFNSRKMEEELKSLTASARAIHKILVSIPIVLYAIIFALNPSYFIPMFQNPLGIMILVIIILLYGIYILIVKKIMDIKE